jgi:hypothetical protein
VGGLRSFEIYSGADFTRRLLREPAHRLIWETSAAAENDCWRNFINVLDFLVF